MQYKQYMIKLERNIIDVNGVVQAVGFRPFVYTIAKELDLKGFVLNNDHGVHIEIESTQQKLDLFLTRLQDELPPMTVQLHWGKSNMV